MAVIAGAAGLFPDGLAFAQCQYEVTAIIQAPPCDIGTSPTFGQGLNINGEIVGYYWPCAIGNDRAFFWSQDTGFVTLPNPPGVIAARAYDVNDNRMIVGQHLFPSVGWKGFAYDMATGEYQHLEPLHDGATATSVSSANAINNAGVVAGMRIIGKSGNTPHNAVIWRPFEKGSPVQDLGVMNGPNSNTRGINEAGDAVGWAGTSITTPDVRAILWIDGVGKDIGVLPGMVKSVAKCINNHHEVIGTSGPASGIGMEFLWKDQVMTAMLPPDGYDAVGTTSINDVRQVTGHIRVEGTSTFHPFLWQHNKYHNLNSLVVGDSPTINHGSVLSESGLILARAGTKSVLLTPVSVPFADLDFNCTVDIHDLIILLENWGVAGGASTGKRGPNNGPSPDLNGDGIIDGADLLLLLANWG